MLKRDDKKAAEDMLAFVIYIILAVFIILALLAFIRNSSSKDLLKQQILAKEISLLVDSAQAGTEIIINKAGLTVTLQEKKVIVKSEKQPLTYSYDFISPHKFETETTGEGETTTEPTKGTGWLWITLLIIVVLVTVGYYVFKKKK